MRLSRRLGYFAGGLGIIFCTTISYASDVPQSFTLDGRLYKDTAGTLPLTDGSILFRVQILDEAKICILYEESQTYSTLSSSGYFSLQVGTAVGSPTRTGIDSGNSMATIFQNINNINGKKVSDSTPCTVTATAGNRRYVRVGITPPTLGGPERVLAPDINLDSVPNAVVAERAETLQGFRSNELLKVNTASGSALSQSNLESLFTSGARFTALSDVVDGNSTSYVRSNAVAGAPIPTFAGAPSTPAAGSVWYDTSTGKLNYQNAGGAVALDASGGGGGAVSALTAATATNAIDNLNFAQTWSWSTATTGVPWSISANSLTTGSLLDLTTSSASLNSTNGLFRVANTGAATTGIVARVQANSTAGSGLTVLANGNVGIGTTTPATALQVVGEARLSALNFGTGIALGVDEKIRILNTLTTNNSGFSVLNMMPSWNPSVTGGTADAVLVNSTLLYNSTNSNSGSATSVAAGVEKSGTGNLTKATGIDALVYWNAGTGTDVAAGRFGVTTAGGSVTSAYGVKIGNVQGTNKWSLHASDATAPSYFAGRVGIGTTAPNSALDLNTGSLSSGTGNTISATTSVVLGNGNTGTGTSNLTMGLNNVTTGNNAANIGYLNAVSGVNSIALGEGLYSSSRGQVTVGSNSVSLGGNTAAWVATDPVFVIGNGSSFVSPSNAMTVLKNGNVGIGTTAPATALDLNGAWSIRGMAAPVVSVAGQGRIYFDSTANKYKVSENNGAYVDLLGGGGGISGLTTGKIPKATSATAIGDSIITEDTGKIGIGTATPANTLDVNGTAKIGQIVIGIAGDRIDNNLGTLFVNYSSANNVSMVQGGGKVGVNIYTPGSKLGVNGNLSVGATYAASAAPTSGAIVEGNVGIGTTTPAAKLHVNGGSIVATAQSISTQCVDFSTGNIQVSSYVATNAVQLGGLVDGGAYTLVLTGYTAGQTITFTGFTDTGCTAAVTTGVDFGGSSGAVTPTLTAVGNTQLVTFIYSSSRGVVYASAGTNFYR